MKEKSAFSRNISDFIEKKLGKPVWIGFCVMFIFCLALTFIAPLFPHVSSLWWGKGDYIEMSRGWEVSIDGRAYKNNEMLPAWYETDAGAAVTVENRLPDDTADGDVLMFYTDRQDITVEINGEVRLTRSGKSTPAEWIVTGLSEEDAGGELSITAESPVPGFSGRFSHIYAGSKAAIIWRIIVTDYLEVILCLGIIVVGVCGLFFYMFMRKAIDDSARIGYVSLFFLFSGLGMLFRCLSRQVFFANLELADVISFSAMFFAVPALVMFVEEAVVLASGAKRILTDSVSVAVCIIFWFLTMNGFFAKTTSLIVIQTYIAASVIYTMILIWRRLKSHPEEVHGLKHLLIGFAAMTIGIVLDTVVQLFSKIFAVSVFGVAGVFVFGIAVIFRFVAVSRARDEMETEAELQNLKTTGFLANMSHAIRTPVNVVRGMNALILRDAKEETSISRALDIRAACDALMSNINDILDISRVETGSLAIAPREYKMKDLLRNAVGLVRNRAEGKGLEFRLEIDQHVPSGFFGDDRRLSQVLVNVLNNAVKYTKEGSVLLSVSFWRTEGEASGLLEFTVEDTGFGIKKEDLPKIFGSYMRSDEKQNAGTEGTGLGLSIALGIMELMGGTITARSTYGKGSSFRISCPQKVIDDTPIEDTGVFSDRALTGIENEDGWFRAPDKTVLAVDDAELSLKVLVGLMAPSKMQIDTATSGAEGLELSRQKHYDLILLDHMMPEMNGVEVFRRIRSDRNNPNYSTPVIALTANAVKGAKERYLDAGFAGYIPVPVDEDDLIEIISPFLNPGGGYKI